MRPLCQSTARSVKVAERNPSRIHPKSKALQLLSLMEDRHLLASQKPPSRSPHFSAKTALIFSNFPQIKVEKTKQKGPKKEKGKKTSAKGNKSPKRYRKHQSRISNANQASLSKNRRPRFPQLSCPRKSPSSRRNNVFTFMPYLHF